MSTLLGLVLITLALAALYPVAIFYLYGRTVPKAWASLPGESISQVEKTFHPVIGDDGAEFWTWDHWWGYQQLFLTYGTQNKGEAPKGLEMNIYVNGLHDPVFSKDIGASSDSRDDRYYVLVGPKSLSFSSEEPPTNRK